MAAPTTMMMLPQTGIWSATSIGLSGESVPDQRLISIREFLDCEVKRDRKKESIHEWLLMKVRGL
jgi:hypothetical protein